MSSILLFLSSDVDPGVCTVRESGYLAVWNGVDATELDGIYETTAWQPSHSYRMRCHALGLRWVGLVVIVIFIFFTLNYRLSVLSYSVSGQYVYRLFLYVSYDVGVKFMLCLVCMQVTMPLLVLPLFCNVNKYNGWIYKTIYICVC